MELYRFLCWDKSRLWRNKAQRVAAPYSPRSWLIKYYLSSGDQAANFRLECLGHLLSIMRSQLNQSHISMARDLTRTNFAQSSSHSRLIGRYTLYARVGRARHFFEHAGVVPLNLNLEFQNRRDLIDEILAMKRRENRDVSCVSRVRQESQIGWAFSWHSERCTFFDGRLTAQSQAALVTDDLMWEMKI